MDNATPVSRFLLIGSALKLASILEVFDCLRDRVLSPQLGGLGLSGLLGLDAVT